MQFIFGVSFKLMCACSLTVHPFYFLLVLPRTATEGPVQQSTGWFIYYSMIDTVVLSLKGSELVFNMFLSVLAAQRAGDHVLKLLMTSHVLVSDAGMCPMLKLRPAVHLHVTFIRN